MIEKGVLYLVATPIGNLEDITYRAVRTLKEADIIAAEDTRQTLRLLNAYKISRPVTSYYHYNRAEKGEYLVKNLLEGKNVALVSDAGTPGISDPGEDLVKLAAAAGIRISIIPGPAAVIAGLVMSGLPSGRFVFEGFLPVNSRGRKERLAVLKNETRTMVFYEAPHKLLNTLKDLAEYFGSRSIAIAREITKIHEEVIRSTLTEAVEKYTLTTPRGEFVLIVEGACADELKEADQKKWRNVGIKDHMEMYISEGMDRKAAMKKVAEDRGVSRRDIYAAVIRKTEL